MRGKPGEEDAIPAAIDGRPVISRADMQALHGVSVKSAYLWYRDREATGHPEPAGTIGRTTYWYEDEWLAWYGSWRDRKVEQLTQVDRGGAPDDLVDAAEAARIMGYSGRDVIHANTRLGHFPAPDDYGMTARGRRAPLWWRSTVWDAADGRTGKGTGGGRPPGTPHPSPKPHPYAGDQRLDAVLTLLRSGTEPSTAALAAQWHVSQRTAERIVRAARSQFPPG
jgi:hypothetical protein